MPTSLPQVGPAPTSAPAPTSQKGLAGKEKASSFSSILDLMSKLVSQTETAVGGGVAQGLHAGVGEVLKRDAKPTSGGTDSHSKTQSSDKTQGVAPDALGLSAAIAASGTTVVPVGLPVIATPLADVEHSTEQTPAEPITQSQGMGLAAQVTANTVTSGPVTIGGPVTPGTVAFETNMPPNITPGTIAFGTISDGAASAGSATDATAPAAVPGNNDTAGATKATEAQSVSVTPELAASDKAGLLATASPVPTARKQAMPVPSANTKEKNAPPPEVGKPDFKHALPNEKLSAPSQRLSETTLNLSRSKTAAKPEIENALTTVPGKEARVPTVSPAETSIPVAQSSQSQIAHGPSSVTTAVQDGSQDGFGSTPKNGDGGGNSNPDSEKRGSPNSLSANASSANASGNAIGNAVPQSEPSQAPNAPALLQNTPQASEGKNANGGLGLKTASVPAGQAGEPSAASTDARSGSGVTPYPNATLSTAKLVERMGESELRLGIRSGEFGNVDIRTSMVRNQFTAEISVERGELGRVLAAELPSLQNRLSEQRIPVANIVLQNQAGSNSGTSEQQKPREGQTAPSGNYGSPGQEGMTAPVAAAVATMTEPTSRLDIHM